MKISLDYYLFNNDPYEAFAERYNQSPKFWVEIFHNRYMWRGYNMTELREIIHILSKLNKKEMNISEKTIRRWIYRTEIYNLAQKIIQKGVRETDTEYFGEHEDYLIKNYKLHESR